MTRQSDGSVLYAVYGTLRRGHGNHNYYLSGDKAEYLGTMQTDGSYTMFSMGGFPGVARGGTTPITVEIYRVTDESVMRRVNGLEGYSGVRGSDANWYDTTDIQTEWGLANMFTQDSLLGNPRYAARRIESGDWNNI